MSDKIAITATGTGGLNQPMDPRFGRAPAFMVADAGSGELLSEETNAAVSQSHGAGTASAALMSKLGVKAVIAGRFGPKAYDALAALGVEMWTAPQGLTAGEALERFRAGSLTRLTIQEFR